MDNNCVKMVAVIGMVLFLIVGISLLYWDNHNKLINDMVKSGADPVAVMCALQDDYGIDPKCIVLAAARLSCNDR